MLVSARYRGMLLLAAAAYRYLHTVTGLLFLLHPLVAAYYSAYFCMRAATAR